jgi:NAD(P)H dehydrogenase (quinone)
MATSGAKHVKKANVPPLVSTSAGHVVITSACGAIGKALIAELLRVGMTPASLCAITRDMTREVALSYTTAGINVRQADMNDLDTLTAAFAGAGVVCILPTLTAQNHTELALNALRAAERAKVSHVVVITSTPIGAPWWAHSSEMGRHTAVIEEAVKACPMPRTVIRIPVLTEALLWTHDDAIKTRGTIFDALNPLVTLSTMCISDVAEAISNVLFSQYISAHAGKVYTLGAPPYSPAEAAGAIGAATGKPVEYVHVSSDAANKALHDKGWQEWQVTAADEVRRALEDAIAVPPPSTEDFKFLTGREPLTIDAWANAVKPILLS